jgi:MerR family transcriptional regulator, copper efflux regulator
MYIGKVSKLTGATPKAIRHYETIGLLSPPKRVGKYRCYFDEDVKLIRLIKCAQTYGFQLSELRSIVKDAESYKKFPDEKFVLAIEKKKKKIQCEIDKLLALQEGLTDLKKMIQSNKCSNC